MRCAYMLWGLHDMHRRIQVLRLGGGSTFLGIRIAPPLRDFPEATIKVYTWFLFFFRISNCTPWVFFSWSHYKSLCWAFLLSHYKNLYYNFRKKGGVRTPWTPPPPWIRLWHDLSADFNLVYIITQNLYLKI